MSSDLHRLRRIPAFTLVELMVSMATLAVLLLIISSITDATRRTWTYTNRKVEQFRGARDAFDTITQKLSQATLNTYWDYDSPTAPTRYLRQSELRFIAGQASALTGDANTCTHAAFFQAPLSSVDNAGSFSRLETLLNTCGYFVRFGDDSAMRPPYITPDLVPLRHRFRLMEMLEPADVLSVYDYTNGQPDYKGVEWFADALNSNPAPVRAVSENIIALVMLPKLPPQEDESGTRLAPNYSYDSTVALPDPALNPKNQLPPLLQVTLVAVDEDSYSRFQATQSGHNLPVQFGLGDLFQTAGDLLDPTKPGYAEDLRTLEETLRQYKLQTRVFTTNVSLKAAKWSREQRN